jgi:transposase-like protein
MPTLPDRLSRWTEEEARQVIAALERSGKPVAAFAAEHGLDPQRVYYWRRRVAGGDGTTFRELIVRPSQPQGETAAFEVALAGGDVVRVPASFDDAALARLLDVLARARAC